MIEKAAYLAEYETVHRTGYTCEYILKTISSDIFNSFTF